MYLLKGLVAKHNGISTSKIICLLLLLFFFFLLLCCFLLYSCCAFAVVSLCCFCCCIVVVVVVVVLFDIGRAISLNRIPSNGFYQKPKWFFMVQQPLGGQGFLVIESPGSHSDTHTHTHTYTVWLLWAKYQPNAEASTSKHTHAHTHIHKRQTSMPLVGFVTAIPGKRGAVDPRLRTRGYWDRLQVIYCSKNNRVSKQERENKIA